MASTFTDDRGKITDLMVGNDFSVTHITFKRGAIRGQHYHKETKQIDIILTGSLMMKTGYNSQVVGPGDVRVHLPGTPHAYRAEEDSEIISICFGKRIGENYEKDTFRIPMPFTHDYPSQRSINN